MKSYNDTIASNAKVELIHVSLDRDDDSALEWAKSAQFPWPHVLPDKHRSSGLMQYASRGVPHYALIDKNGKVIVTGKRNSFQKIKELTKQPSE